MNLKTWFLPSRSQRLKMLRWDILIGATVIYIALAFAYLFPIRLAGNYSDAYLSAYRISIFIRAFLFHFGLGVGLGLVAAAWMCWWREVAVLLPLVVFCFHDAATDYLPKRKAAISPDAPAVSILSANLLFNNTDAGPLLRLIERTSPDVLLFQEYTKPMDDLLVAALGNRYPYATRLPQEDAFGSAFFSRLPLAEEAAPAFFPGLDPAPQLRGVVRLGKTGDRQLAIYNIHLVPIFRTYFLEEHNFQLAELARLIETESLPCVGAGDFNFTTSNAQSGVLRNAGLRDAWKERGWGRGSTWCALWPLRYLPGFRIDQMQMNDSVECIEIKVLEDIGSDHYPLLGIFAVKQQL